MKLDCLSAGLLVADHLCAPIRHLPRAGELVLTRELSLAIGGCAANAAVDLARLGIRTAVAGCVGNDLFGRFVTETLQRHGVEMGLVRRLEGVGTSATMIVNVAGEDRRYIHMTGANAALSVDDIPIEAATSTRVLYVGGYLLLSSIDPAALRELFAKARKSGVRTVLDVVFPGPGDHWPAVEAVLPETDVFLPNEDEGRAITGLEDPVRQAERFHAAGAGIAVVTCGERGTVLVSEDVRVRAGVYPMEFVGGTGAGDAFDAGFIAGLVQGADPIGCLKWGSALGASCVRDVSATESVFRRDEALAFMAENRLELQPV
jgi:sugar/nucleoside kinase (ribokinase family)